MTEQRVRELADEATRLKAQFFSEQAAAVARLGALASSTLADGGKILLCGNGGSASDCQHIAAELVGRFRIERAPLPALALTTDTSALTAIGNDFGFERIFELQVQALGRSGDLLLAFSTSGNSENVVRAVEAATELGLEVAGLLGGDGGRLRPLCEPALVVPHRFSARVQEVHITIGHILCDLIEDGLGPRT